MNYPTIGASNLKALGIAVSEPSSGSLFGTPFFIYSALLWVIICCAVWKIHKHNLAKNAQRKKDES